jgi:hypothetical protein
LPTNITVRAPGAAADRPAAATVTGEATTAASASRVASAVETARMRVEKGLFCRFRGW